MDDSASPKASADTLRARGASGGVARACAACGYRGESRKSKAEKAPPSALRAATSPANAGEDERLRVSPNKNRLVQVRRVGKRKLFDRARKETFLEWLAGTCNTVLSSEMAGICDKTVYKHLLKDDAFVEAFGRAVQVGYLRLEARQMMEAHRPALASFLEDPDVRPTPAPPCQGGESYEIRILPEELAEEHFDPVLAMQLLREHRRHLPGSGVQRPAQRTTASSASAKEVADALAKRLKHFAVRHGSGRPVA